MVIKSGKGPREGTKMAEIRTSNERLAAMIRGIRSQARCILRDNARADTGKGYERVTKYLSPENPSPIERAAYAAVRAEYAADRTLTVPAAD